MGDYSLMERDDPLKGLAIHEGRSAPTVRRAKKDFERQCVHEYRFDGEVKRCQLPPLVDAEYCARHLTPSKPTIDVLRFREQMIDSARYDLLRISPKATNTIENLLDDDETPANVKLKAATEILDRIGVRGGTELDVRAEVSASPTDEIRRRLAAMAEGLTTNPPTQTLSIEAEGNSSNES